MKRVDIVYGVMFFISSIIYAVVLEHFIRLSFVMGSFLHIFGVSILLMIGTVILTNSYIANLSYEYLEYVSLTYAVMGVAMLLITKDSLVFTCMCAVLSVYYLVRFLKFKSL